MTYKASDKFTPYDWWFDKNVPKAQYGSLQCWLYKEKEEYINAYDMLLGSCSVSYTHLTLPTTPYV